MEVEYEEVDVMLENSDIHRYSKEVGFTETETCCFPSNEKKCSPIPPVGASREVLDMEIMEKVEILLSKNLIFEEDRQNLELLFTNFEIREHNTIKSMFKGYASFITLLVGFFLYFFIGALSFLSMGAFYAYRASDYLWRKYYEKKRLEDLMTVLEEYHKLIKESYHFINENNHLLKSFVDTTSGALMNEVLNSKLKYFKSLEKDFIEGQLKCINLFKKYNKQLSKMFPLVKHVQDTISPLKIEISEQTDLSKIYLQYVFIQSEFLQRAIYCFVPSIISNKSKNSDKLLNCLILKMTHEFSTFHKKLSDEFKYAYLNGIMPKENEALFRKILSESKPTQNNELVKYVHETSLVIQKCILNIRSLEEMILKNASNNIIEQCLELLQSDLKISLEYVQDSQILFRKNNICKTEPDVQLVKEELKGEITEIGMSTLDPEVEDEIYELQGTKEDTYDGIDYEPDESNTKNKMEKECLKNVLKELETKLIVKANERKAREAKIMKKKAGISDDKENLDLDLPLDSEIEWPLRYYKRCLINRKNGRIVPVRKEADEIAENYYCRKNELSILSQSILNRQKVFDEDVLCGSGENSDEDF